MSQGSFAGKIRELYSDLCEKEWNPTTTGILVALFTILIMAWWRPWGTVGAVRNWGDWFFYYTGFFGGDVKELVGFVNYEGERILTKSVLYATGSVIGIGFLAGAFISACLGGQFAFRFPPYRELVKAVIAGVLMGIGATLAGGCNVGGIYNALGNLAANGFSMWFGMTFGVIFGLWLLYKEMEHVTWGSTGSWTFNIPRSIQFIFGIAALSAIVWGAYAYVNFDGDYHFEHITSLSGIIVLAAALGYTMQRGRWCMVQGFREPHMTGDTTMAKSVALSIAIVAVGAAVLKYGVEMRFFGEAVLNPAWYVRGTFGWAGVLGGFIFGLGAMFAGGCGTGTLWRIGEGQIKLWVVLPFFALTTSVMGAWFRYMQFEADGVLGHRIYLPDVMGYGPTLLLICGAMALWYVVVTWNEDSNKLILPM